MIRIQNETEFLSLFRPIDRDQVQLPHDTNFPLAVSEYLSWVEPSGHRTYLIFEEVGTVSGLCVVFTRSHPPAESTTNMCQWCHSVAGSQKIGILTAQASKKTRVGLLLCRDLSCRKNIETEPPDVNDLRESLSRQEKLMRVRNGMSEFARRNLF